MFKDFKSSFLLLCFLFKAVYSVAQVDCFSGNITIGTTASGAAYAIANGILKVQGNATIPVSDIVTHLQSTGNLTIDACDGNLILDASILPNLSSERTLTLKAAGEISFLAGRGITASGNKLNLVFWSDSDGNGAGDIFFGATGATYSSPVTLNTNGGHLFCGGGSGEIIWNGLAVGDSYAVGNSDRLVGGSFTHNNGITIQGTAINTQGGNILMRAKGKAGDSPTKYSGGMYLVGSGSMNSGGGDIEIEAVAQSGSGQKYGLYNLGAYTFAPGSGTLKIIGDASACSGGTSNVTGNGIFFWTSMTPISASGDIILIGRKSTHPSTFGVDIRSAITTTGGEIVIDSDRLTLAANLNAGNGIQLGGDILTLSSLSRLTSAGDLKIHPFSPATTIGMAGASGALQLPASYFSTNFVDGFGNITIGSNDQTGNIACNAFNLRDNMTLLTSGSLTLGGRPVLGANHLTLGKDIAAINLSTGSNYFQTNGTGKVLREVDAGASRLLPIGNSAYNPVTITNKTGTNDVFAVRVLDEVFANGLSGDLISTPRIRVTWDIDKYLENGGDGVDFAFSWDENQETEDLSTHRLIHHDGASWRFAEGTSQTTVAGSRKTMQHTGYIGGFSPFALGDPNAVLPVTLMSFEAICLGEKVHLAWTTASEFNNDFFRVYGSTDAINWTALERVEGYGTTNVPQRYQVDLAGSAYQYFRLLQQDYDGTKEWLPVVRVDCDQAKIISAHPNPFDSSIIFSGLDANLSYSLKVYRENGQLVASYDQVHSKEIVTQDWQTGIYLLMLQSNRGEQSSFKLLRR